MSRATFQDEFKKKYDIDIDRPSDKKVAQVDAIPTGIVSFDIATGIGGFPKGRIVEIFGPESGGKTLLSLIALSYAQKMFGSVGMYFDLEDSTPEPWMQTLGINLDLVDVVPPGLTAEKCLDAIIDAIESNTYTYIIVDSVAAMISDQEFDGAITDNYMGVIARVMGKGIKKIISALSQAEVKPCVIFINQLREKIGVMYGSNEITPGGKTLKFFASQRYRARRGEEKKDKGVVVGHEVHVVNVKNKLAPPKREGSFFLSYLSGVDTVKDISSMLKSMGMYAKNKAGKYVLTVGDEELAFSTVKEMTEKIASDKEFQIKAYNAVIHKFFDLHGPGTPSDEADDDFAEFSKTGEVEKE
jgi:recombination protein RecA